MREKSPSPPSQPSLLRQRTSFDGGCGWIASEYGVGREGWVAGQSIGLRALAWVAGWRLRLPVADIRLCGWHWELASLCLVVSDCGTNFAWPSLCLHLILLLVLPLASADVLHTARRIAWMCMQRLHTRTCRSRSLPKQQKRVQRRQRQQQRRRLAESST